MKNHPVSSTLPWPALSSASRFLPCWKSCPDFLQWQTTVYKPNKPIPPQLDSGQGALSQQWKFQQGGKNKTQKQQQQKSASCIPTQLSF